MEHMLCKTSFQGRDYFLFIHISGWSGAPLKSKGRYIFNLFYRPISSDPFTNRRLKATVRPPRRPFPPSKALRLLLLLFSGANESIFPLANFLSWAAPIRLSEMIAKACKESPQCGETLLVSNVPPCVDAMCKRGFISFYRWLHSVFGRLGGSSKENLSQILFIFR